ADEKTFKDMESLINQEEQLNALIDWEEVTKSPATWGTIVGTIVSIFLFIVTVFLCKRYVTRARIRELQVGMLTRTTRRDRRNLQSDEEAPQSGRLPRERGIRTSQL